MALESPTSVSPEEEPTPTRFFLRGLAASLPPILTLVILLWILGAINTYVISPTSSVVRYAFAHAIDDSVATDSLVSWEKLPPLEYCQTSYRVTRGLREKLELQLKNAQEEVPPDDRSDVVVRKDWVASEIAQVYVTFGKRSVPYVDYYAVATQMRLEEIPATSTGVYMELVTTRYFKSMLHLSLVAVVIAIVILYFLGRFVTVKLGNWMWRKLETGVLAKVPVVSNVYSSVKQVTDFFFTERTVSYNRVVALEYPRKGLWSIGFVTGDGMREIELAGGEPMLSILMPTSPMPMTGFTITVPKSAVVDLDLTLDQAFQFCLSCGVLIPPQQKSTPDEVGAQIQKMVVETQAHSTPSPHSETPPHSKPEGVE